MKFNKEITVLAKAALDKGQLDRKLEIGCDGIELQLLAELVNGQVGKYFQAEDVYDLEQFKDYDIKVVHAPILSFYGLSDVTLEDFVDEDMVFLEQVFKVADYFGKLHNRKTLIVIHSETTVKLMKALGDIWGRAIKFLGYLLLKYPNTEIGIENVTPLRGISTKPIQLCNNFKFDNVDMANTLRKELNTDRVGTVLDICHAKISKKYMDVIYQAVGDIEPDNYDLEEYFKANKDVIKLIHLADFAGSGYGKGKHGIGIGPHNENSMKEFVELYNKYNYNCMITLEVEENNFLISDIYEMTKQTIDKYR